MIPNLYFTDEGFVVKDGILMGYYGPTTTQDTVLTLPSGVKKICNNAVQHFFTYAKKVIVPEGVEELGSSCFIHFSNLEEIVLPSTLTAIGDSAFHFCGIKELNLPNSVEKIGACFLACSHVEEFHIPPKVEFLQSGMFDKSIVNTVYLTEKQLESAVQLAINIEGSYFPFGNSRIKKIVVDGKNFDLLSFNRWLKDNRYPIRIRRTTVADELFWATPFLKS